MSAGIMREKNQVNENDTESVNDARSKKDRVIFVFYNFETRRNETLEGTENVKMHISMHFLHCATNLSNAQKYKKYRCNVVGVVHEFVFRHPVKEFVDFVTQTHYARYKLFC